MQRIFKLLLNGQFPYLFTLLIGGLAFTFNHLVSRASNAPIIEYTSDNLDGRVIYSILNLTTDKAFQNLEFSICIDSDAKNGKIISGKIEPTSPSDQEDVIAEVHNECARFKIDHLNPKAEYKLIVIDSGVVTPVIYLTSKNTESVLLLKNSLLTFLLENEFCVNLILLATWIVLIVFYLGFLIFNVKRK